MLSPSFTAFHDNVYVLTTESAKERQQNCVEQLGADRFEFFFGVDKRTVSREDLIREGIYDEETARRLDRWGRPMSLGHICCALGHRLIYERMLESGCERVMIFEDDAVDLGLPEDDIAAAVAAVPDDAEIVYWGWSHGKLWSFFGEMQNLVFHTRRLFGRYRYSHRQIRRLYMRPYNEHFYVSAGNYLLHAYTITRRGAEALVRANTPVVLNSDDSALMAILDGRLRGYVTHKQFFGQRSRDEGDPMQSSTEMIGAED